MSNLTMSDAAQIRLAETPPAMCSACFGQYPQRRHIDFGASWDGPVLDGAHRVSIDELVICEKCLLIAAKLLGTSKVNTRELRRLEAVVQDQQDKIARLGEYAESLKATLDAKAAAEA